MRILILPLLLAGCAAAPRDTTHDSVRGDRELAAALAGRTAGAPQRCLDRSRVDGPQVIDRRTLLYRQSGRRLWVNRLPADCPSLHGDSTLIIRVFNTSMCENDQFRTRQPGDIIAGGVCRLGSFTPYDRPAEQD